MTVLLVAPPRVPAPRVRVVSVVEDAVVPVVHVSPRVVPRPRPVPVDPSRLPALT